ncbi:MAG TPA: RNB domain-containing ribonuclease, partial [Sideroxyarcus sp.]|nr:RNB domain-containing ribonuclease [Sideroxyarcus sp.]
ILANSTWGKLLADAGIPAIYRAQTGGRVRMTTAAAPHEGLGVDCYAWSSSPLRRYVDLCNQWQLISHLRGEAPCFEPGSAILAAAMNDFDVTYNAYNEFQRGMERYWCLRWLLQEKEKLEALSPTLSRPAGEGANESLRELIVPAVVLRENLVKLADIPLVGRIPSLPELPPSTKVTLEVGEIDLLDLNFDARYLANVEVPA